MSMKKRIALMSMMALAMSSDSSMGISERGSVKKGKQPKLPEPKKYTPFNEQEGVLKSIKDYNLIKQGQSKKGKTKQAKIIKRVDEWLKSGMLTESDLK